MPRSRRPKAPRKQAAQPALRPDRWTPPLKATRARRGPLFDVFAGHPVGKLPAAGPLVAEKGDMAKVLLRGTFGRDGAITGRTGLFRADGPLRAFQPVRLVRGLDKATVTARRKGSPVGVALPPAYQIDADMIPLPRRPGFWSESGPEGGPDLPSSMQHLDPQDPTAAGPDEGGRLWRRRASPEDHGFYTAIAAFLYDVPVDAIAPTQEARAVRLCEELAAGEAVDSLPSRFQTIPLHRLETLDHLLAQPCVRTPGETPGDLPADLREPGTPPLPPPLAAAMIAAGTAPLSPYPPPVKYDRECPICGKDLSRGPSACANPECVARIATRDTAALPNLYPPPKPAAPAIGETATRLVDGWLADVAGTKVPYDAQTALIGRIDDAIRAERERR